MSFLDHIYDTRKAEQTPSFSEWNKAFDAARDKEDSAINATLAGVASQIATQRAEDLQKDIAKAQAKAAQDVKASYIKEGKAVDDKRTAALKELSSGIGAKIEADRRAYNERYNL